MYLHLKYLSVFSVVFRIDRLLDFTRLLIIMVFQPRSQGSLEDLWMDFRMSVNLLELKGRQVLLVSLFCPHHGAHSLH